jgi:Uma2 family endonuclease
VDAGINGWPVGKPLPGTTIDQKYPDQDGRPMGDTEYHSAAQIWLREGLQDYFAPEPDVYIASNLILYYEEGNPKARRDPDILVARGVVGKHMRRSFRVWEEGTLPRVLFEIISKKNWREDMGPKRELYARIGIREYIVFDPEDHYIHPQLQGFRTKNAQSIPMKAMGDGSLRSRELGLVLTPEGAMLRLRDAKTGQLVLTRGERAEAESQRAEELAAQVADLEREVKRLRRGH